MAASERIAKLFQTEEEERWIDDSVWISVGLVFLFCTICLAFQRPGNLDLALLAPLGFVCCLKGRLRGFIYASALLGLTAVCKHLLFLDAHLWQLGLETSVELGFCVISLSAGMRQVRDEQAKCMAKSQEQTIRNLEEEIAKAAQEVQGEKLALQTRLNALQKDLDEVSSECFSLQILNEVLRKSAAEGVKEREAIAKEIESKDERISELLSEIRHWARLPRQADLIAENEKFAKELSEKAQEIFQSAEARKALEEECAQGREANIRLQEQLKALGAELALNQAEFTKLAANADALRQERASLTQQKLDLERELDAVRQSLQERSAALAIEKEKAEQSCEEFERINRMLVQEKKDLEEKALSLEGRLTASIEQIGRLQDSLKSAEEKAGSKSNASAALLAQMADKEKKIEELQERLRALAQSQAMYFELRKQFEEKGGVLHQTRSELFRAETSLQALQLDRQRKAQEVPALEQILAEELSRLAEEHADLEAENEHLFELIGVLSSSAEKPAPKPRKKKVIAKRSEGELLF